MLSPSKGMSKDGTPTMLEEEDGGVLVTRAQSGDREAYETLFARSYDQVRLFVRLRLGARLRAKLDSGDVLQEAWMDAHRAFPNFEWRGPRSFTSWLCRIAEHRIRGLVDHHNAQKRKPPEGLARVSQMAHRIARSQTGPATRAGASDEATRLALAMDDLSSKAREVLLLRFFQELTIHEIAELTGHSATSTRRHLGTAMRELAASIEGGA